MKTELKKESLPKSLPAFKAIEFTQVKAEKYEAEYGDKNDDFIFHIFFPEGTKPPDIDKTFLKVFRDGSRLRKLYVEEMNCWTYIVKGFATNPFAATLKKELFRELDNDLK